MDNVSASLKSAESESQLLKSELNDRISQLAQIQRESERFQVEGNSLRNELSQRIAELNLQREELKQKQEHSQWLQNEWDEAEFKIKVMKDIVEVIMLSEIKISSDLQAVYKSTSWRITKPLRFLSRTCRKFFKLIANILTLIITLPTFIGGFLLRKLASIINRRPQLKKSLVSFIVQYPNINLKLRQVLINNGINVAQIKDIHRIGLQGDGSENLAIQQVNGEFSINSIPLPPEALRIFTELKKNISMKKL